MIKVKHDSQYLSYTLDDNAKFFPTGYRVLKKQKDKGFIKCSKINYNGHIKLLYPVGDNVTVFSTAENWTTREVFEWLLRILKMIMEVQDSGFLRVEDIDIDLSSIFIDEEKKQVRIVVLPLISEAGFVQQWHTTFAKSLITLVGMSRIRDDLVSAQIKQTIWDNATSLDLMHKKLKVLASNMQIEADTGSLKKDIDPEITEVDLPKGELHLKTRTSQKSIDIAINKEVFILGKNPKLSDYAVNLSPTISRQHCQIIRENGAYYIEDLNSLNHTYVNGEMLSAGQRVLIKKGTHIRLAEIDFSVEFRS
ncbi:MAG: FHA domain-containing protein [Ruminococcus sp.]|nr:FHA domain-containing protein [Ruminococcus sp.]